jgi:hypothetical protein
MFGFIKNLIAGIVSFITGLLPGKKNGGYYLQLEETGTGSAPVAEAKPAATSNGTKAAAAAPQPEPSPKPVQTAKKEASQNGKAAPTQPAPAASTKPTTPTETTFAPKYLTPSVSGSNGRRRPGANMNTYLDMARQVKTPG